MVMFAIIRAIAIHRRTAWTRQGSRRNGLAAVWLMGTDQLFAGVGDAHYGVLTTAELASIRGLPEVGGRGSENEPQTSELHGLSHGASAMFQPASSELAVDRLMDGAAPGRRWARSAKPIVLCSRTRPDRCCCRWA
jgi:hypothetical protein